ncbi:choice-of-anchor Q domain-containing protein [Scytonema sp. NUACC26]|uniref:choice-of-anchor Q domain-containing protein n=1 Tax=Scytonema sp. NUACC26 TaxID=3140176 RepID=UPI0034DC337E
MSFTNSQSQVLQNNVLASYPDVITNPSNPQNPTLNMNGQGSGISKGVQETIDSWTNNGFSGNQIDGNNGSSTLPGLSNNDRSLVNNGNDNLYDGSNKDPLTGGQDTLVGDSNVSQLTQDSSNSSGTSPSSNSAPTESISSSTPTASNSGTVYYVSPDGSDDNPGTSDKPWKSVNYAVGENSAVEAGDTILVQPGTYSELVTLGKSGNSELGDITLKANGDVTLRDPDPVNGGFREGVIQSVGKGNWVIDGFRIEDTSWAGISVRDANNITIQNNHTYNTGSSGIIAMPDSYFGGGEEQVTSKNIKVLNNTVEKANARWQGSRGDGSDDPLKTQESLSIWGVDGFEVANNTVKDGTREGIDIKTGSRNGSVHDNYVTGQASISGTNQGYQGGPAIYVDGFSSDTFNVDVYNNVITDNVGDGIVIADEVPNQGDVSDIRVYNNLIYGNGLQGVNSGRGIGVISNVRDVEIVNNTVVKNVEAIEVDGSSYVAGGYKPTDIVIRNNIFTDSTYRNGLIEDAGNLTLDNNLFSNKYENLYEGGTGIDNLSANNNTKVQSAGFVNSSGNDFHLTSASPAIDTGSSAIGQYAQRDKDGVQRPQGAGTDIGAYEYASRD